MIQVASFLELGLSVDNSHETFLTVLDIMFDQTHTLVRDIEEIQPNLPTASLNIIKRTLQSQTDGIYCQYREQ